MREYLDGKQGTWDPHKDIEAEVEFDKMMAPGGPSQGGFVETLEDVELLFSFFCLWDVFLCISYVCTRLLFPMFVLLQLLPLVILYV